MFPVNARRDEFRTLWRTCRWMLSKSAVARPARAAMEVIFSILSKNNCLNELLLPKFGINGTDTVFDKGLNFIRNLLASRSLFRNSQTAKLVRIFRKWSTLFCLHAWFFFIIFAIFSGVYYALFVISVKLGQNCSRFDFLSFQIHYKTTTKLILSNTFSSSTTTC